MADRATSMAYIGLDWDAGFVEAKAKKRAQNEPTEFFRESMGGTITNASKNK